MADNYLLFSEVLAHLTPQEEAWLGQQLRPIAVQQDGQTVELASLDDASAGASWVGPRFLQDKEDYDPAWGELGFQFALHDDHDTPDGWGRHLWFYAEESGTPDNVAWLVRKFLKQLRPGQCWSLTYAATCSKPRVGEFSGGAVFVTAERIKWQDAHSYIEQERVRFERARSLKKGKRR
jgi:hypothetical protein